MLLTVKELQYSWKSGQANLEREREKSVKICSAVDIFIEISQNKRKTNITPLRGRKTPLPQTPTETLLPFA